MAGTAFWRVFMAEDASAAAAVDGVDLSLGGWMSALADFPAASGGPIPVRVWWNGTDKFSVTFGTPGGGLSSSVWTTAEGLETVIAQCQRALDVSRGSQ
jgi:hypothetical protein